MAKTTHKQPSGKHDQAPPTAPSSEDDVTLTHVPTEDGGVDQHPVHDSDMEDAEPQDFEEMIDAAGKGGFDPTDKYEVEREAGLDKKHSEK